MDEIIYRFATLGDVQSLVELRLAFLAEASGSAALVPGLSEDLREYFTQSIPQEKFLAAVALSNSKMIASSGLVLHYHPPGINNPTGREAYIMNMYTVPAWRRRGIAARLLEMLLDRTRSSRCGKVFLHVLPPARSIYVKAGFIPGQTEMRKNLLPISDPRKEETPAQVRAGASQ